MGEQYSRIFEKGFPWSGSLGGRDLSKIDETAAERLCGAAAGRGSERQPEKTNEFDYRDQGAPSTMQKTDAVQSANEQGQQREQPIHEETIDMVMADVCESLA